MLAYNVCIQIRKKTPSLEELSQNLEANLIFFFFTRRSKVLVLTQDWKTQLWNCTAGSWLFLVRQSRGAQGVRSHCTNRWRGEPSSYWLVVISCEVTWKQAYGQSGWITTWDLDLWRFPQHQQGCSHVSSQQWDRMASPLSRCCWFTGCNTAFSRHLGIWCVIGFSLVSHVASTATKALSSICRYGTKLIPG